MARRGNDAVAAALQAIAQAVGNQNNAADVNARNLATFQRENPPTFKRRYDPDGALSWLNEIERIFRVMECTDAQKVKFGTHMLAEEADKWWLGMLRRLDTAGEAVTWEVFTREFKRKYYPEDVRAKKEVEFLELKQGNKTVAEYAAKFEELAQICPYYANGADSEFSKCVKFESGLRPDIKKAIGYQEIRDFARLVDKSRIYEEDNSAAYKIGKDLSKKKKIGKEKRNNQFRGKPYDATGGKNKWKAGAGKRSSEGKKPSGGDASADVVCYTCGKPGHKSFECKTGGMCFRCGKKGRMASDCDRKEAVCFNCGEAGHFISKCTKPKKEKSSGRVFALAGSEGPNEIRGDRV